MPRQARLDAPGTLHHVIARGIERSDIYRGDRDRRDFLARVERVTTDGGARVFAWALMPNHFHLLLRTGQVPLSRLMRRLMTGYAIAFNLRHDRHGHLFQNRYKSLVCEAEPYLLELVRYIHRNPLRGGVVADLAGLRGYPYCGHGVVLGVQSAEWQDVDTVLMRFGTERRTARRTYEEFVAAGGTEGYRPDLVGGAMGRSSGPWPAVVARRQRGDGEAGDTRILGSEEFRMELLRDFDREEGDALRRAEVRVPLAELVGRAADLAGVPVAVLRRGSRRAAVVRARAAISQVAAGRLGYSGAAVARYLGVATSTVNRRAAEDCLSPLAAQLLQEFEGHRDA